MYDVRLAYQGKCLLVIFLRLVYFLCGFLELTLLVEWIVVHNSVNTVSLSAFIIKSYVLTCLDKGWWGEGWLVCVLATSMSKIIFWTKTVLARSPWLWYAPPAGNCRDKPCFQHSSFSMFSPVVTLYQHLTIYQNIFHNKKGSQLLSKKEMRMSDWS